MSEIWNKIDTMVSGMTLSVKIQDKRRELKEVNRMTCGQCRLWMTSECVPEKQYKQFKSSNSTACNAYLEEQYITEMRSKLEGELQALMKPTPTGDL